MNPDRTLRSRSHQVWCLLTAAFCLIFVVGGIVVAITKNGNPGPQIVLAVVFAFLAGLAVHWSRASASSGRSVRTAAT